MFKVREEELPNLEINTCKHVSFAEDPLIFKVTEIKSETPISSSISLPEFEPEPILKPNKQPQILRRKKYDMFQYMFFFLLTAFFLLYGILFESFTSKNVHNNGSGNSIGAAIFDFLLRLRDLR